VKWIDPENPSSYSMICQASSNSYASRTIVTVLYVYNVTILLVAGIISCINSFVIDSRFSDAQFAFAAFIDTIFAGVLRIPVRLVGYTDYIPLNDFTWAIAFWYTTMFLLLSFFFPKFYAIYNSKFKAIKKTDRDILSQQSTTQGQSSQQYSNIESVRTGASKKSNYQYTKVENKFIAQGVAFRIISEVNYFSAWRLGDLVLVKSAESKWLTLDGHNVAYSCPLKNETTIRIEGNFLTIWTKDSTSSLIECESHDFAKQIEEELRKF
jgi:hypothetical protein